jgi:hypothetical protein
MTDSAEYEFARGDKVRRRDSEEEGNVIEMLPFYGGFGDSPVTVLLVVAVVRWRATGRKVVVRLDDLVKVT